MPAGEILAIMLAAVVLFAGTNVDDMIVLTVLSGSSRAAGRPRQWHIWAGQYAGITVLVGVSLAAAAGLAAVPEHWLWVLGLLPLGLGLGKLVTAVRAHRSGRYASPAVVTGLTGVIGLTIANGGDNVAAYIPVFRTSSAAAITVIVAVFMAGVAVWCLASSWLAAHRVVADAVRRWGYWAVPVVFILIGCYIFYKAGVLS